MWEQLNRIIKDNGAIVLFGSEPFSSALRMSNIKNYKYDWYWKKKPVNFLNARKQPMREIENIMVFFASGNSYYPQGLIYKPHINKRYNSTETNGKHEKENKADFVNYPKNVIEIINNDKGFHPTQKPTDLLEYLIKTYTLENETVLDFTMGSGSTGIACVNTNRDFIGIEIDNKYFRIAKDRIEAAQKEVQNVIA